MRAVGHEYPSMTRRVSPLCSSGEVLVATTNRSPLRPLEMNVFGAADHIVVALAHGGGADAGEIASRARFGHRDRQHGVGGDHAGQPAGLPLVSAELAEIGQHDVLQRQRDSLRGRTDAVDLPPRRRSRDNGNHRPRGPPNFSGTEKPSRRCLPAAVNSEPSIIAVLPHSPRKGRMRPRTTRGRCRGAGDVRARSRAGSVCRSVPGVQPTVVSPPLTPSTCPVMKDASSEAKNNTAAADEKGHARVPAAVIVYLTPMTGNLPASPGSHRSLETANLLFHNANQQ